MRITTLYASLFAGLFGISAQAADWLYLTAPGDTLSQIGLTYLKNPSDWPKVQAVNAVPIPKHLPVNTRIKIPVNLLKVTPAPVTITAVTGNVRYKADQGGFERLAAGMQLTGGETVLTGPRSSVAYRLADASVLTQQASSKLSFGRLAAYGRTGMVSTELSLGSGRMEAHAAKQLAPAGGFRVLTPVAVAGLRGTDFRLNLSEDGKTLRNEVLQGVVAVAAQGQEVGVAGGYGTLAELGKPPEAPRPLLPAPAEDGLATRIAELPIAFSWPAEPGARAYRAQVATDATFARILLDELTPKPTIAWQDDLANGDYVLRLRAIDASGLEGANLDHAFVMDAHPLPPALLAPAPGERVYRNEVGLSWSAAAEAQGYVLQFGRTSDFDQEVIRLPSVTQHTETLAEGDWHWRAASLDAGGKPHAWSSERVFRVQPLPNPPVAKASAEAGQIRFSWAQTGGAAHYGVELGATADLREAFVRKVTTATSLSEPLKPGKYYWRLRCIEGDGQVGPWSTITPVIVPPDAPSGLAAQLGQQLLLAWKGDASTYKVELSSDPGFAQSLLSQQVHEARVALPLPASGDYWVRVTGVGVDGVEGQASVPLAFRVEVFRPWWLVFPLLLVR